MNGIRVLLVDDQAMIRSGIRGLLELAEDVLVVGEAADGRLAVSMARGGRAGRRADGPADARHRRDPGHQKAIRADPGTAGIAVLVLTTFDNDDNVLVALEAGANGFLGKSADHEELVASVRAVASGKASLSAAATDAVVAHLARTAKQAAARDQPTDEDVRRLAELTAREREVVALVVRGLSNAQIAEHLFISSLTVKTHINRSMRKMQVSDRAGLVVVGMKAGILDGP